MVISNVFFYTSTIGTGLTQTKKKSFIMQISSCSWQIWQMDILMLTGSVQLMETSAESTLRRREDLAALQALLSPAAHNTWHIAYLSHLQHKDRRQWVIHESWHEMFIPFFLNECFFFFNWWVMSWPEFPNIFVPLAHQVQLKYPFTKTTLNQTYVSLNCTGYHLAMIKMAIITITHF